MRAKRIELNKWERSLNMFGAAALSLAVLAGCSTQAQKSEPQSAQEQQIKTVKVATISKQRIGDPLEQVADVLPIVQVDVLAKAGGDVIEIVKKRGEMVAAGDVILRLDPTDVQLQKDQTVLSLKNGQESLEKAKKELVTSLAEARNGVAKLERALQDATRNFNKMRNDYDNGLVTKAQLDQAQTQLNNAQMDLDVQRQKLKTLETTNNLASVEYQVDSASVQLQQIERTLSNLEVKAPVSGILTEMPAVVGQTISTGFKVGQVQQLNPIKIKAQLTEEGAKLVRNKKELVYYVPGTDIKGTAGIEFLADVMDAQSKSYEIELQVDNAGMKLKPGMKVQLQLTTEDEQVVVTVPSLSVVREGGDSFVFILNGDTVEKRKVQLGRLNELNQEVISGVQEGEQLVISGQNQLKDKEKVQLSGESK